jgi:hypothetical protein
MKQERNLEQQMTRIKRHSSSTPERGTLSARPWPGDRLEFQRELSRKLGLLRREIAGLRRKVRVEDRTRRAEYADVLDTLELKANRLERALARAAIERGADWERNRLEAVETWRKLKRALVRVALALHQHDGKVGPGNGSRKPNR